METFYELLGVAPDSTTEEIHSAYRRVSKAYHSDHGSTGEKQKRINDADDILTNSLKRREYDEQLRREAQAFTSQAQSDSQWDPKPPPSSPPPRPGFKQTATHPPMRRPVSPPVKEELYWVYFRSRPWLTLFPMVLMLTYFVMAPPFAAHSDFFRNLAWCAWMVFLVIPGVWVSWLIKWLWGRHVSRGLAKSSSTEAK